jgi:parallel beta-helix repeat protein
VPALPAAPGLPKPEPQARVELSLKPGIVYADRTLSEDTTWRGEVLVEGALTVAPQATLTIEPGTVVRFRRKGGQAPLLLVQGRIVAAGTRETPVLFSSSYAVPAASDWQGIMLLGTEKKNLLENCRIEGAQTGLDALFSTVTLKNVRAEFSGTGMRFQDTLVVMEAGGASECDLGLSLSESEATLRNLNVVANRLGISAKRSSVYLFEANLSGNRAAAFSGDGGRVKIQGGAMLGNGSGVTLLGCEGSVTGARIANNREYGISLTSSRIRVSGNQVSGNADTGLIVFDAAAVAWGNAIFDNAHYDLYNAGTEEFRAPANWWGPAAPKMYDNSGRGKLLYAPQLSANPLLPQPQ